MDEHFRTLEKSDALTAMDGFYQAAYSLVSSPQAREAFNLAAEPQKIREEYGMHDAGQRMLMARRMVESGVRLVSLTYGGWDMHAGISNSMQRTLPKFDQAYAALITDLDRRGHARKDARHGQLRIRPHAEDQRERRPRPLAESVLRCLRRRRFQARLRPRLQRPDWFRARRRPLTVENMATTVYRCLGINADKRLMAPGNRPIDIVRGGVVVPELLA